MEAANDTAPKLTQGVALKRETVFGTWFNEKLSVERELATFFNKTFIADVGSRNLMYGRVIAAFISGRLDSYSQVFGWEFCVSAYYLNIRPSPT